MQNLLALMRGHNLIFPVSKCHTLAGYRRSCSRSSVGGTSKDCLLLISVASSPRRPQLFRHLVLNSTDGG